MIEIQDLAHNQPTRLRNVRCAYCNAEFASNGPEKSMSLAGCLFRKGLIIGNGTFTSTHAMHAISSRVS